jgi:hypothetical protein
MASEWATDQDGLLWEPDQATFFDVFMELWEQMIPGQGSLWELKNVRGKGYQLHIHVNKSRTVKIFMRTAMNSQTVKRSEGLTTIGWVAIDEPARMLQGAKAFTNSLSRARNPMKGWNHNPIFIVGTPLGLGHWTTDAFGCTTDHPASGYFHPYEPNPMEKPGFAIRACLTKENAKNLKDGWEEFARLSMSDELAAQDFNASLQHSSGMVLPEWRTAVHVLPHEQILEMWERRIQHPIGGTDWGQRIAASEVCGWTKDHEFLVIDEWYARNKHVLDHGMAMWKLTQDYAMKRGTGGKPTMPWYCDPAEGGTGARKLLSTGWEKNGKLYTVASKDAKNAWDPGIGLLRALLQVRPGYDHPLHPPGNKLGKPSMFVSDRCKGLISEAPACRLLPVEAGKPFKMGHSSMDPLCDDHAIDATRYPAFSTATRIPTRSYGRKAA